MHKRIGLRFQCAIEYDTKSTKEKNMTKNKSIVLMI